MRTRHSQIIAALLFAILAIAPVFGQQQPAALKILVVTGEDAVNIVQQKTAVAPVVEIRDRNDQPVAGAAVRFAIRSGKATFGGPKTLTLTTNAAGRASVTTLTPTGTGLVQITATASFQGQTAAITIAQTNVATAAAAAAGAGTSSGTAATAGGTAGGSSGGLSVTTIAIAGGAAAGGAVATNQFLLNGRTTYQGDLVGDIVEAFATCANTYRWTGRLIIEMSVDGGDVSGVVNKDGDSNILSATTCSNHHVGEASTWGWLGEPQLQGTPDAIHFHAEEVGPISAGYFDFVGRLENGVITGTLTATTADPPSQGGRVRGGGVFQVVAR